MFHVFVFGVFPNQKREGCDLLHVVERRILYKTVYMVVPWNSIFPSFFSLYEYTL